LTLKRIKIENEFQNNFERYIKQRNDKDYFSYIDILNFFNDRDLNINWEELTQLVEDLVQKKVALLLSKLLLVQNLIT
jgi:hypothetical protein